MIDRDIPKGPIGFGVLIIELQGVKVLAACAVGTWSYLGRKEIIWIRDLKASSRAFGMGEISSVQ